VGLGIGSVVGILFAPKSGEETREYMAKKTREGNVYACKKVQELRNRAEETFERGKEIIADTKGQIATAIDAGRQTYHREKMKAQGS
jgi:gas vesicle protein